VAESEGQKTGIHRCSRARDCWAIFWAGLRGDALEEKHTREKRRGVRFCGPSCPETWLRGGRGRRLAWAMTQPNAKFAEHFIRDQDQTLILLHSAASPAVSPGHSVSHLSTDVGFRFNFCFQSSLQTDTGGCPLPLSLSPSTRPRSRPPSSRGAVGLSSGRILKDEPFSYPTSTSHAKLICSLTTVFPRPYYLFVIFAIWPRSTRLPPTSNSFTTSVYPIRPLGHPMHPRYAARPKQRLSVRPRSYPMQRRW
jgi:hypothetical protein